MDMKKSQTTGFEGVPTETWKQFCKTNDFLEY